MDVGDDSKYLLNEGNNKKADGLLVIATYSKDQDFISVQIPEEGNRVRIVGVWITDKGFNG